MAKLRIENNAAGWRVFRRKMTAYPAWGVTLETRSGADMEELLPSEVTGLSGIKASHRKVEWTYDAKGRRIGQKTSLWTNSTWIVVEDLKFIADPMSVGRHIAELNATNNTLVHSYVWGLDLSGTLDGTGGVGGLLWVRQHSGSAAGVHYCAYDGNGNIVGLVSANTGTETARYEYAPFGEPIRVTGPAARSNPFRFSTKRTDNTTDLVLYEYRAYNPTLGRWLSRDPIGESGGLNRYGFGWNDTVNQWDLLGLLVEAPPAQPPTIPPEPITVPRVPPPTTLPQVPPRIGPPQAVACAAVAVAGWGVGYAIGEHTGFHDAAAEGIARCVDTCKRVFCKHRHPTWPSCRKGDPKTPEEAMGSAIGQGRVPVYPGFNGPHLVGCELEGAAWGCPGMANGGFYECKVAYWSQWSSRVTIHYYTVLTCGCCYTFTEGSYALFRHRSGNDKTSPPKH